MSINKDLEVFSNKELNLYRQTTDRLRLEKFYTTLGVTPTDPQKEQIRVIDIERWHWFITVVMGRRSGKSFGASVIAVRELMVPYASVKIIAPIMKITDVIWKEVITRLRELNIKPVSISNKEKTLTLENGSQLFAAAETNKESVLGTRSSLIIIDEAAIFTDLKQFVETQLLPTLMDYGVREDGTSYGRVVMISSPRGKGNYFYNQFLKGKIGVKGYYSMQYPSSSNPLVTQEYLEAMKEACTPLVYQQEYEAQFVSVTDDTVFHGFNHDRHVIDFSKYRGFVNDYNTIVGIDIGFSDSASHAMVMHERGKYYIFSGTMFNKVNTKTMAERYQQAEQRYTINPQERYIDPSAALTAYDLSSLYDYFTFPAKNNIKQSLALLNQLFEQDRLFIADDCHEIIQQIAEVEYNHSKTSKDPFKKHNEHHWDLISAIRYAIYTHYRASTSQEIIVLT